MANRAAKTYDCDVLVIGGGLAGAWAAIRAKDFTNSVILVDKAKVSKSGASSFTGGVMLAPQPGDDFNLWTKELAEAGNYLNDQDWIGVMLNEQPKIIDELQSWGIEFEKDENGRLVRIVGRGHVNTRMIMFRGLQFMQPLRKQIIKRNITLVERVMITDLLTSDGQHPTKGRVVGAVGFNVRTGDFQIFQAKAVVLATGGAWGSIECAKNLAGDGVAMGYRAGVELHNMEFAFRLEGWVFERKYKVQGFNLWQNAGCYLVNRLGERFMAKYDPLLKERATLAALQLGFTKEGIEGRGPIYIDMRHFSPETWDRFRRVVPNCMRLFDLLEPWKRKLQFDLGSGGNSGLCSGINHNVFCETNLPGLFVAGQVGGFPAHGTFSVGGVNLALCCVGGRRAGEYAAQYSKRCGEVEVDKAQLDNLEKSIYEPLLIKDGIAPDEIDIKIKEMLSPAYAIFRSEEKINRILEDLGKIKALLPRVNAPDYHELVKAIQIKNYLLYNELVYRAALERKESRGPHSRSDYPYRDDVNWLKRIILRLEGDDKVSIRLEPIPIYRYPAKPEKLEQLPPPVPPVKIE